MRNHKRRRAGRAEVVVSKTYLVLRQHRSTLWRLTRAVGIAKRQDSDIVAVVTYGAARRWARTALDALGLLHVPIIGRKAGERNKWGVYGAGLVVWLTSIRYTLHDWLVHVWRTTTLDTVTVHRGNAAIVSVPGHGDKPTASTHL